MLFDSVSNEVGRSSVGLLLTGIGHDDAHGLLSLKRNGAMALCQNEGFLVVYVMPKMS